MTLPCTLWFLGRGKANGTRKDEVLFVDARHIFRQVTRAVRDFEPEQIEFLANVVRLHRGEQIETEAGSKSLMKRPVPRGAGIGDVAGLCKAATRAAIEGARLVA